jgi:hypothetical protein
MSFQISFTTGLLYWQTVSAEERPVKGRPVHVETGRAQGNRRALDDRRPPRAEVVQVAPRAWGRDGQATDRLDGDHEPVRHPRCVGFRFSNTCQTGPAPGWLRRPRRVICPRPELAGAPCPRRARRRTRDRRGGREARPQVTRDYRCPRRRTRCCCRDRRVPVRVLRRPRLGDAGAVHSPRAAARSRGTDQSSLFRTLSIQPGVSLKLKILI